MFGIDLCYDKENSILSISIRYQKERAEENLVMRDLIGENLVEPTETQTYAPNHHSYAETVKRGSCKPQRLEL